MLALSGPTQVGWLREMFFLKFALTLLTVSTTSGIPYPRRTRTGYSVTIMNDSSLGDFKGAVHTWLAIRAPHKPTTYFSFTSADFKRELIARVSPGRSSVDEHLKQRTPSEQTTLEISLWQYNQMIRSIDEFYRQKPVYSMLPTDDTTYNCVTAANRILSSANIHLLRGYRDPVLLGLKLATVGSVLGKCLATPNIFMFLSFTLFSSLCVLL
ncbi:hypothetical protein WDU94_015493 [Cyamophila willieti]